MLWVCVLLPDLPLEIFTRAHEHDASAALRFAITTGGHHPRIVIANAGAHSAGISRGQLVSAAYALAPDAVLRERDEASEQAALARVAAWLTQFTPMVSIAPPQAVLAEIGGSCRLFGGLQPLLGHLEQGVRTLGFSVQTACAPTPTAAQFVARAGERCTITRREDLPRALASLPLAHLGADAQAVALLREAGVTTFAAACALPRDALARRAGAAFVSLLDRARDLAPDPREPFVPPARYSGRLELPCTVSDTEALGFAVHRLVHELAGWLQGRGLGVNALALHLEHERFTVAKTGMPTTVVDIALASPARDVVHLATVVRERLARVALPAPVQSITLASRSTAPLAGRNLALLPGDSGGSAVPLLDRLRARLGDDAVTCVVPHEDHRPERASRETARTAEHGGACIVPAGPRPLWLLREPQPLGATFEQKPWVLRDGPERIEAGWWDGADIRRDYYIAESPRGERLWIYRDSVYGPDGEWFLHGVFA